MEDLFGDKGARPEILSELLFWLFFDGSLIQSQVSVAKLPSSLNTIDSVNNVNNVVPRVLNNLTHFT